MQLGFVSAILPDLSLEEVASLASSIGYGCVEVMCWPKGKAERRYAGVTHVDVVGFGKDEAAEVNDLMQRYNLGISGLGYYPNPLAPDESGGASLRRTHQGRHSRRRIAGRRRGQYVHRP